MNSRCRRCGGRALTEVVDLGEQALSGIFPREKDERVEVGFLKVGLCGNCQLAQLMNSFSPEILYGDNYGYRSGLNGSMVSHLNGLVKKIERSVDLNATSLVVDIGANDGTLLRSYAAHGIKKIAIDPTIAKFERFYAADSDTALIPELFTATNFWQMSSQPADVVTSIAMFYDLEDPVSFAQEVYEIMAPNGIWVLEQSYAPWMTNSGAYDTICHEHLEYYTLSDIVGILGEADLVVSEVATNQVNGGSFTVTARKKGSNGISSEVVNWLLDRERSNSVSSLAHWQNFASVTQRNARDFKVLLERLRSSGHSIMALGASTKGNVILQTSGIGQELIPMIGEINEDKYGCFTPGTAIPIVPEHEVVARQPDFLVILPWHFREGFVRRLASYLEAGGHLIFPLPDIEIVGQ